MIPLFLFLTFISPIWIDPLFNHFGPMKNKPLEKKILTLACKAGIEDTRIFEVDKSVDTKVGNAYVNGIGNSKRIVLWDTIIDVNHPERTLFVVAHEMGHYVLHHIWILLGYYIAITFAIFYLTYKISHLLLCRFEIDMKDLPLLFFLISLLFLLQTPLFNILSRYLERESDRFGIELTENNVFAAECFADFAKSNLINPRPGILYTIWRSDHPSIGDRIDFCNNYAPWESNQPLKYGRYFHTNCQ
jgi:Zn-dependent protease with chaperone function